MMGANTTLSATTLHTQSHLAGLVDLLLQVLQLQLQV